MEQQSQQPEQEQKDISSSKNFLANPKLPFIVAAVAIILIVGGILLLKATQPASPDASQGEPPPVAQTPQPSPSPQPQMPDSAGWQTYRNEEFGFEVKYPPKYFVFHVSEALNQNFVVLLKESDRDYVSSKEYDDDKISYIRFDVLKNPEALASPFTEIAQEVWAPFFKNDVYISRTCSPQKTIGLDSLYCSFDFEGTEEFFSVDGVILKQNSRVFVLEGTSRIRDDRIRSDFLEILSTFRFIE